MSPFFHRLLRDATRFTHSGNLGKATAAIQAALIARSASPAPDAKAAPIDVEAREAGRPASSAPVPWAAPAAPVRRDAASADVFIGGSFTHRGATRDYKLYIPPATHTGPLPLVVMLHGCTQGADDFAAGTGMNDLARERGFLVLYPEQSGQANVQRCWNWFKHSHQARDRGEPALLAALTQDVAARHGIDAGRVYVAGLSAGGAMAAILGETHPELYAAVGVHSGLAAGIAHDLPTALGAMKGGPPSRSSTISGVPTIVFHGDADATVHPGNGQRVIDACLQPGAASQALQGVAAGGRPFTRHVHSAQGRVMAEHWVVHGAAHAWSGGRAKGSYTDPRGPDASAEMLRFFLTHAHR